MTDFNKYLQQIDNFMVFSLISENEGMDFVEEYEEDEALSDDKIIIECVLDLDTEDETFGEAIIKLLDNSPEFIEAFSEVVKDNMPEVTFTEDIIIENSTIEDCCLYVICAV